MTSQLSDCTTGTAAIIPLAQAVNPAEVGHQAATLAALLNAGLPVPDGVIVPIGVISGSGDLPDDLVTALADTIRGWGDVPVAVRSSGIAEDLPHASYAGLYTTVLDVRGEENLREAVSRCWASARKPSVIAYAGEVAAPDLAVLVQPMVDAVAAGVAFTADPVTGDRGVVVIDAVRGLGEQLVSGAVTPDRWEVRAEARRLGAAPGGTPAIDATTACAIAALARRTEELLGLPQDLEWALSGNGTLVVLQSRPVTTLPGELVALIPLPVEPPEGYWVREASHAPLPWTLASSDDAFWLSPDQLRAALREGIDCHALATRRAGERAWALAHPGPPSYGRPPGPPPPLRALPAQARLANEAFLWNVEQVLGSHTHLQSTGALMTTIVPLDAMVGAAQVDLLDAFAYPLPITVIRELLGVPAQHRTEFHDWSSVVLTGVLAGPDAVIAASTAMVNFLRELIEMKRLDPADDLLSALVAVRDGADQLSEDELTSMAFLLLVAGHETTVNLIGNGMLALLTHPQQLARLQIQPERIPAAIEELLRFDGALQVATLRLAAEPIGIGAITIQAGEIVVPGLLPANRDPACIPQPDALDITRTNTPHLAFGHGIHHCPGAALARLEGRIALGSLLARFAGLHLAVPPDELNWRPGVVMHSLIALPVALE